jgi:hypothetical protein
MKEKLIEKYPDNYKLRALINLIPNIGGALDVLLTEKGNNWREQRLVEFLSNIESRIENLESNITEKAINDLSNSEETYDLLIQSFNSVIRTRHSDKISFYANILVNHIISSENQRYSSELLISILDNLTMDEIKYLSALHNSINGFVTHKIFGLEVNWEKCQELIQVKRTAPDRKEDVDEECVFPHNVDLIWKLLRDKNIVIITKKEGFEYLKYSYGNSMSMVSSQITSTERKEYQISDFGKEFITWIIDNEKNTR